MQPCSQPRYGLIERSKPISGESLRAMIVRVASPAALVATRSGCASSPEPQPSSKAPRFSSSKRPLSLLAAPRPLRALTMPGISMPLIMGAGCERFKNMFSVIIPTLNAAEDLPATLAGLTGSTLVGEILVADGGSRDDTVVTAKTAGAHVVQAERGRGPQLAAGAAAATGDWLLFLHADCRLAPGWEEAVAAFLV